MGVTVKTFYEWQARFEQFREAVKRGKAPVDIQVENALLKRALGYEYTERHIKRKVLGYEIKNGQRVPILGKESYEEVVTKQVIPDTLAQIYWLKNRRPDKWRDKPTEENMGTEPVKVIFDV